MAEVSGLVLGSIALASLYSTCKDLFEFFELSRNHTQDYELATTKIILLKIRFVKWGEDAQVEYPGHEVSELRANWTNDGDAILRSLSGVNTIFGDAATLGEKYGLRTRKRGFNDYLYSTSSAGMREIQRKLADGNKQRCSSISTRRKASWAIHDKRKFDSLIADLDFLITNLEKISQRLYISYIPRAPSPIEQFHASVHTLEAKKLLESAMAEIQTLNNMKKCSDGTHSGNFVGTGQSLKGGVVLGSNQVAPSITQADTHHSAGNKADEGSQNLNISTVKQTAPSLTSMENNTAQHGSLNFNGRITSKDLEKILASSCNKIARHEEALT